MSMMIDLHEEVSHGANYLQALANKGTVKVHKNVLLLLEQEDHLPLAYREAQTPAELVLAVVRDPMSWITPSNHVVLEAPKAVLNKLAHMSIEFFGLPPDTYALHAIPPLLEGIHLQLIDFHIQGGSKYALQVTERTKLYILQRVVDGETAEEIISNILSATPPPATPTIVNSADRHHMLAVKLTGDQQLYLSETIAPLLITRYSRNDIAVALNYLVETYIETTIDTEAIEATNAD